MILFSLLGFCLLTGYTVHTSKMLTKMQENGQPVPPRHYNGVVRNSANRQVHLLTFSGTDSGALFSYRKNLKSIQRVVDTRELVTRLYAYGKDGMTFASINGGKEYVEDYTFLLSPLINLDKTRTFS